ncbi:Hydrogen cyanide synthase subunit HcnB [compost metagenome]
MSGASVRIVDEAVAQGGQIYRAITRNRLESRPYLGKDYWLGRTLSDTFESAAVHYAPRTRVWCLEGTQTTSAHPFAKVGISLAGVARFMEARRVILATGAMERPMPVPGWTLPGVLTAGAAQIALKTEGLVPRGDWSWLAAGHCSINWLRSC